MKTFPELVASRREWIANVLQPWCRAACRRDLLLAEQEWQDIAGRAAPEATLWLWAWSRFPALCAEGLATINETSLVTVQLNNAAPATGYPDARRSQRGELVLIDTEGETLGPFSIDEIVDVQSAAEG